MLQQAMWNTTLLVVPTFSKINALECDALGRGLGGILMQEGNPLTFTSN